MSKHAVSHTDRRIGLIGITIFALAGAVFSYAMPMASSADAWFAAHDGTATTGLLLGLLLTLTGTTVVRAARVNHRGSRHARPATLPQRLPRSLEQLMSEDSMEAPPSPLPSDAQKGSALPLELVTWVQCRDRDLCSIAHTTTRLVYRPVDPYALNLYVSEPEYPAFRAETHWTASRDAFISAGCHGTSLPGLDIVVTRVAAETRAVPTLRVTLYETDLTVGELGGHTGYMMHLDFELNRELRGYLERIIQAVPPGSEHEHLDLDGAISQLLGAQR